MTIRSKTRIACDALQWLGIVASLGFAASAVMHTASWRWVFAASEAIALETLERSIPGRSTPPRSASPRDPPPVALPYNPFCPTCRPDDEVATAFPDTIRDANGRLLGPRATADEQPTTLPLQLLATMIAEDPRDSLASVFDPATGRVGVYAIGDTLAEQRKVVAIARNVVHLRHSDDREYLAFIHGKPPPPSAPIPEKSRPANKPSKPPIAVPGAKEAIRCSSQNSCVVKRRFVDQLITNPKNLARQGRLRPHVKDGKMSGFRLSLVRKGSLSNLLGLRNGDILLGINGRPLDSMDAAMALYTKLRSANHLSFTVDRKGKSFDIQIAIE